MNINKIVEEYFNDSTNKQDLEEKSILLAIIHLLIDKNIIADKELYKIKEQMKNNLIKCIKLKLYEEELNKEE